MCVCVCVCVSRYDLRECVCDMGGGGGGGGVCVKPMLHHMLTPRRGRSVKQSDETAGPRSAKSPVHFDGTYVDSLASFSPRTSSRPKHSLGSRCMDEWVTSVGPVASGQVFSPVTELDGCTIAMGWPGVIGVGGGGGRGRGWRVFSGCACA